MSDLDSIVTDLFPERRVSGSGDNATMAPAIVTRLSQSSTASSSVNDDGGEGAQKTLDEIFDYISTRMLRGTLTESMFVRVLSVNNAKNKTGVFKQLFRVLRLYQRIVRISQDLGHQTETRSATGMYLSVKVAGPLMRVEQGGPVADRGHRVRCHGSATRQHLPVRSQTEHD